MLIFSCWQILVFKRKLNSSFIYNDVYIYIVLKHINSGLFNIIQSYYGEGGGGGTRSLNSLKRTTKGWEPLLFYKTAYNIT